MDEPEPEAVEEPEITDVEPEEPKATPPSATTSEFDLAQWPQVLDKVKTKAASLYTALRLAEPRLEDDKLVLAFQFPLHQKKLAQAKNLDLVGKIIEEISGAKLTVSCIVDKSVEPEPARPASNPAEPDNNPSLETISNIFGAAEMLES
jgi:DNA polymerase-3 subunit gamma/tau